MGELYKTNSNLLSSSGKSLRKISENVFTLSEAIDRLKSRNSIISNRKSSNLSILNILKAKNKPNNKLVFFKEF